MLNKITQKIAEKLTPKVAKNLEGTVDNTEVKKAIHQTGEEQRVNKELEGVDTQSLMNPERVDDYVNPTRTSYRNWSLDQIETADDIVFYMDEISKGIGDDVGAVSDNVQTHEQTLKKAKKEIEENSGGASLEDILNSGRYINRKPGEWTTSQLTAARQMLVGGAEELHEMATSIAGRPESDVTEAEIFNFRKNMATYQALKRSIEGGVNEAARIVNSMRIPVSSPEAMGYQVQEKLNELGGRSVGLKYAQAIALTGGDPTKVSSAVDKFSFANIADAAFEHWLGLGLLSDPMTHKVNMTGNMGAAVMSVGEAYAATLVGKSKELALKAMGKKGAEIEYHTLDQANAYAYGLTQGVRQMWNVASRTFKEADDARLGQSRELNSVKSGATHAPKFKAETFGVNSTSTLGGMLDWWGKNVTRMSFRLLEAEDEAFKVVAKTMERNRLAYRYLESEGLDPSTDEFYQRAQNIISGNDPVYSAVVDDGSDAWARYQTFTDEANDAFTRGVSSMTNARVLEVPVLKGFVPFIKILTNLTTYSLERTPIAPLMPKWLERFNSGGADRDLAVAQLGIGLMATYTINEMMSAKEIDKDGNLVARPSMIGSGYKQWADNAQMKEMGVQQYSIIIDGKSHDISRLSPVGQTIMNITSALEMYNALWDEEEKSTWLAAISVGVGEAMADQTFFQGFADFIAIANGDKDFDEWMAQQQASFVVPNAVNRVRKFSDDKVRYKKSDDYFSSLKMKIADRLPSEIANRFGFPGSEDLQMRYTPLGEPILNDEMGWYKWSPLNLSEWTMLKQPYANEDANIFYQAQKTGYTIKKAKPTFNVKIQMNGVPVTQTVDLNIMDMETGNPKGGYSYSQWSKLLGETKKKYFREMLKSKEWKQATIRGEGKGSRYELFSSYSLKAGDEARAKYLQRNKDVLEAMAKKQAEEKDTSYTIPDGIKGDEIYKTTGDLKL